jgi:hypothetical protein
VDLLASSVTQFLGTSKARLVFVNATAGVRTLCAINFSSSHPWVKEFKDKTPVYCPTISPDGRYVAFATRNEGLSGSSQVYIRPLDSSWVSPRKIPGDSCYVPRWWIDRSSADTFLIYTNSAMDNASPLWPATVTFRQKISRGRPVGTREAVVPGGAFHDGISWNGRFAATGYRNLYMRDLGAGETRLLFTYPQNGKDQAGSGQVCNVSISPDRLFNDRCLFLDFGYPRQSALVGTSYGIHEYVFMADFSGKVLSWYRKPSSAASWSEVEWSNDYRFAVAGGQRSTGETPEIHFLNVLDGSQFTVVRGTDLHHPALWVAGAVSNPSSLATDSLGLYCEPPLSAYQNQVAGKLHLFWKMHRSLGAVFVGSSQVFNGIDCSRIRGMPALNMGYGGCGVSGSLLLVRNYVLNHCPNIKVVCMSATPYWLAEPSGDGVDLWRDGITQNKGFLYDQNHGFWQNGLPPGFDSLMAAAPSYLSSEWDTLGLALAWCAGWGGSAPDCQGRIDWTVSDTVYQKNFNQIRNLALDLAAMKIHFLMVSYPESPAYRNTAYFGRLGPSWATGEAVMEQFKSLEAGNPYFHFYDAYRNGEHDYSDAEAGNCNHLCTAGAAKLTTRLDSLMHTFQY